MADEIITGLYPQPEAPELIYIVDDDGNEIAVRPEDFWQYEVDAMRCRPTDNETGGL